MVGLVDCVAIALLSAVVGHQAHAVVAAAFAGSLLGFLRYNFPHAKLFLGDAGAMLIGMFVGILSIKSSLKGPGTVLLAAPLCLMALPLSLVSRLEEFPRNAIERTGPLEVVQYRGQIMPLVRISAVYHEPTVGLDDQRPLQVVVYAEKNRCVGLVVDRILDIVEETLVIEKLSVRPGIRGSAVIQKRVADILDVEGLVRAAHPDLFAAQFAA